MESAFKTIIPDVFKNALTEFPTSNLKVIYYVDNGEICRFLEFTCYDDDTELIARYYFDNDFTKIDSLLYYLKTNEHKKGVK